MSLFEVFDNELDFFQVEVSVNFLGNSFNLASAGFVNFEAALSSLGWLESAVLIEFDVRGGFGLRVRLDFMQDFFVFGAQILELVLESLYLVFDLILGEFLSIINEV